MLGQDGVLELRPGLHVICVPTIWKIEGEDNSAEAVCLHVAKHLFGEEAELFEPETWPETLALYSEVFAALKKVCDDAERKFDVTDPIDFVVHIGGKTWAEAGLRWVRMVKVEIDGA